MKELSDYWGGFLAGFTSGEGHFSIDKLNRDNPRTNYHCRFRIALRDDDRAIIEEIRDTLGLGTICGIPANTNNGLNNQAQTVFNVSTITDCAVLAKVFEKYPLRSKKKRDFAIWKEAVRELQKPRDCRDAELLEYYFQQIKQVRQYEAQDELVKPKRIEFQLTIEY